MSMAPMEMERLSRLEDQVKDNHEELSAQTTCLVARVEGLEVRDKNNYELIMSHDTMIKNLCALLNTSYPPSHRPEGDTLKSLQKEAAKLIQRVIDEWGSQPADGPPGQVRFYEYKGAYEHWLHGPGELDAAWGTDR